MVECKKSSKKLVVWQNYRKKNDRMFDKMFEKIIVWKNVRKIWMNDKMFEKVDWIMTSWKKSAEWQNIRKKLLN